MKRQGRRMKQLRIGIIGIIGAVLLVGISGQRVEASLVYNLAEIPDDLVLDTSYSLTAPSVSRTGGTGILPAGFRLILNLSQEALISEMEAILQPLIVHWGHGQVCRGQLLSAPPAAMIAIGVD